MFPCVFFPPSRSNGANLLSPFPFERGDLLSSTKGVSPFSLEMNVK